MPTFYVTSIVVKTQSDTTWQRFSDYIGNSDPASTHHVGWLGCGYSYIN